MNFNLGELNNKSLDEIKKIFIAIPSSENEVVFNGGFSDTKSWVKCLSYLPRYIEKISFQGFYLYYKKSETIHTEGGAHSPGSSYKIYHGVTALGLFLDDFVFGLPLTISEISLAFASPPHELSARYSSIMNKLLIIVSGLPNNIIKLNLNDAMLNAQPSYSFVHLIERIPRSVLALSLKKLNLSSPHYFHIHKDIFLALPRWLEYLSLERTSLHQIDFLQTLTIEDLPPGLKTLDLGFNNLGLISKNELTHFLSRLPQELIAVVLTGNKLSNLSMDNLREILHILPATVEHVDLSENGFLSMCIDELTSVLHSFRSTVTSLRICESNTNFLSIEDLCARFTCCLPPFIDTISFANSKFLGRSISDFVRVVQNLPETIKIIDLSDNGLVKLSKEDLIFLFAHIPPHIRKIKLNKNGFSGMDPVSWHDIMASLPKNIVIELAANGFENLPYTRTNQLLNAFPYNALVGFGNSQLRLRGNGVLVVAPNPALQSIALFRAQKNIRHQSDFSFLQLTLMQLTQSKKLGRDIIGLLITFLFACDPHDVKRITKQIAITSLLVPAKDVPITLVSQLETRKAVEYRVQNLIPGDTTLNLSRCGLNRLSTAELIAIFNNITTESVSCLILKSNGFLNSDNTRSNFIASLQELPETITHIDLSDNGFDRLDAGQLKALFMNFPKTVRLVSLSNEKPISPAEQITSRITPKYYLKLIKDAPTALKQASILLNDYSKGDSAFKRFISGHWGRTHTEDVVKLEFLINNGILTNLDDVLAEIEGIKFKNAAGCLSKRSMFLTKNATIQAQQYVLGNIPALENLTISDTGAENTFQA